MLPPASVPQKRFASFLMIIGFVTGVITVMVLPGLIENIQGAGIYGVNWSLDSEYIVVHAGDARIYSIQASTGDLQELFDRDTTIFGESAVDDYWHVSAWTADGRHLVGYPVEEEIVVADVTNGSLTTITDNDSDERGVTVSPTGSNVAYWVYGSQWRDDPYTLRITDLATSEDTTIVEKPHYSPTLLAWSNDGTQLAYWNRQDDETTTSLMAYDLETGESRTILEEAAPAARELSWSPDSAWITYWTHPADMWGGINFVDTYLHVVNVQTSEQAEVLGPITFARKYYRTPIFWSPDGSRFAFSSNSLVYIIDPADGSSQTVERRDFDRDHFAVHIGWQGEGLLVTYSDGGRERVVDGEVIEHAQSINPLSFLAPDGQSSATIDCEESARPLPALDSDGKRVVGCRGFELEVSNGTGTRTFTVRDFTNDDETAIGLVAATVLTFGGGFWLYRYDSRKEVADNQSHSPEDRASFR